MFNKKACLKGFWGGFWGMIAIFILTVIDAPLPFWAVKPLMHAAISVQWLCGGAWLVHISIDVYRTIKKWSRA